MAKRPVHFVVETGSLAGGVRIIGEMANRLVRRGWPVAIWSVHKRDSMSWFPLDGRVEWYSFLRTGTVADYDPLTAVLAKQRGAKIATFWRTALTVKETSEPGEGFYLVQDVETSYTSQPIVAEFVMGTYDYGLAMLTTSRWVAAQLPAAQYVGIGVDNYWTEQVKLKRQGYPLACARRQALKGWREMGEVARYLAKAGHPITFWGLDPKLPLIAQHAFNTDPRTGARAKKLPLTDAQLRDHYSQAGVFLATSRHEGFSLTPLEAMACGCPVVMTPADGNLEYAEDGVNCLLADTPRAVADAAVRVLRDPGLAKALSAGGKKTAARYRWDSVIDRLENFLSIPDPVAA